MRKYAVSEQTEVLSPEQHVQAQVALHDMGKTSARELTEAERLQFLKVTHQVK